jgi:hypothetical protein
MSTESPTFALYQKSVLDSISYKRELLFKTYFSWVGFLNMSTLSYFIMWVRNLVYI